MMSIQESEEYDFYPASEFQNAYAISRMEMDHGDVQQINEHVAAGRFVVVESGYKYCQMTDACLGVANYLISVHETHEEAEAAIPADIECDGEIWFHVVPAVNSHPAVPVPTNDSDKEIPF